MKRAVLVGIDSYQRLNPLEGCVRDVKALEPLLKFNYDGTTNFACQTYTSIDNFVDRRELLTAIDTALAPGADVALFFFAGHGVAQRNDVVLACQDGRPGDFGVALSQVLGAALQSTVPEVLIVLDCCFSGGAGTLPQLGANVAALREGLSLLTASRRDQTAAEAEHGLFSSYLCAALDGGAADVLGQVNIAGIYAYLSESFGPFDQRPTFKINVDRLHSLRKCKPGVPFEELKQLAQIFASATTELKLDPTYEATAKVKKNELHLQHMKILQHCRDARLVETIGVSHLYYAAIQGKSCRLTPLGRHYWSLAKADLI